LFQQTKKLPLTFVHGKMHAKYLACIVPAGHEHVAVCYAETTLISLPPLMGLFFGK
jgi:hypothetical protein